VKVLPFPGSVTKAGWKSSIIMPQQIGRGSKEHPLV